MSMSAVFLEGVRRAAAHAALLFNLNSPQPAVVPPPAVRSVALAPLAVDGSIAATGLTLVAQHVDARIADGKASVLAMLLLRNDTGAAISAQYVLPFPARVIRGDRGSLSARPDAASLRDDIDLPADAAEQAETDPGRKLMRYDVIVVAPGEQITFEVLRDASIDVHGGLHRLRLPLSVDPGAPWTPRFTADVLVEADRQIRRLTSPTHPALVDGLDERTALLSVEEGRVHRQTQLAVEFELGTGSSSEPELAFDREPVSTAARVK
jgi:hypothetical protein